MYNKTFQKVGVCSSEGQDFRKPFHRIHVWYIYLDLVNFYGKWVNTPIPWDPLLQVVQSLDECRAQQRLPDGSRRGGGFKLSVVCDRFLPLH